MLRESQNFFFDFMSRPDLVAAFKKNRSRVLKKYFRSEEDQKVLMKPAFERFETYRKHISMGLLGSLEKAYPVLRSLIPTTEWNDLLNDFYRQRLTRSPIARHVFHEFSHYLQKKYRGPLLKKLPYLREMAEYENIEIKLFYAIECPLNKISVKDLIALKDPTAVIHLVPILNPHHALRVYRWPVHLICKEFSSPKKVKSGRYPLLVYRDPETLKIRFLEASPLVAEFVQKMKVGKMTIEKLLQSLLQKHKPLNASLFVTEAMGALSFLNSKGVILGFSQL